MTEDEFLRQLLRAAKLLGWRTAHFRPARTARGWRTAVAGDGAGWPDLVLVKDGRLVVAELKSAAGRVRDEQRRWLEALEAAGVETHVWRPDDWDAILEVLRR